MLLVFLVAWLLLGVGQALDWVPRLGDCWRQAFTSPASLGAATLLTAISLGLAALWGLVLYFLWQDIMREIRWTADDPSGWIHIGIVAAVLAFFVGRASVSGERPGQ